MVNQINSFEEACLVCTGSGFAPVIIAGAGASAATPVKCPHCRGTGRVKVAAEGKKDIIKIVYESERGKPPLQHRRKPRL